jgi:hypothetical protein
VRGLPANFDPDEDKPGAVGAEAAGALAATMDDYRGVKVGNIIDCEGGSVVVPGYFGATAHDRDGKVVREFKGVDKMMQNFIDVVRSRKTAELHGPIEEGHISSALCHLGVISHHEGVSVSGEKLRELREITRGKAALHEALGRMLEHLAANRVDFAKTVLILGQPLELSSGKEEFTGVGSQAANALLTRAYRAPYVVPQLV